MKKVFSFVAVAAAMLVAGTASAQLSVNAGYLNGTMKNHVEATVLGKTITNDTTVSMGSGFFVGGSYNVELIGGLGVAPGVYINYLSRKDEDTFLGAKFTNTTNMLDINVPIMIDYKLTFGDDFAVFAFVGPNIRFGLSANSKTVNDKTDDVVKDDLYVKEDGETDANVMKRFDIGLMFGAGVQYNSFRLQAGYNMGLLDRCAYKDDSNSKIDMKANNFFVGVGYAF